MITPTFLLAILLAFAVFGAFLSSIAQLLDQETMGKTALRGAHGAAVAGVLAVMGALSTVGDGATVLGLPPAAIAVAAGLALSVSGVAAMILDSGWKRFVPAPLVVLGLFVASGAPFAA